ncbi:DUF6758 family protein [Nocardioides cavernaquae]|uniref:Uncharacterized protein n=1 Tax=Nocardioides cavernaquae TaxID=2321396 RepID=A0A3A5H9X3_9ACTN|nr:DUF6758 family protein [Nocardioides cavernaquae]RJS46658.1 hypothetical protein D4739_10800 [Nocardioides cavernaquae]
MALLAGCPRCSASVSGAAEDWECPEHGPVTPLWRPAEASYDAFVEHLSLAESFPTYLPWPLGPGWQVTDFGTVGTPGRARASFSAVTGTSDLDGPVEVLLVAEEPGVGLGARVARTRHSDPGTEIAGRQPEARLRLGSTSVPLWSISTHDTDAELDRSVLAGEAEGRWLWVVLRPASAILLMSDAWKLADASEFGPHLVATPFGGHPSVW